MKVLTLKFNLAEIKQLTVISKNEKSMFFKNLKESKLFRNQRFFHSIILSFASENALNFSIFYFHANERIYYYTFRT